MAVLDTEHIHENVLVAGGAGIAAGVALVEVGGGLGGMMHFMRRMAISYFEAPVSVQVKVLPDIYTA